MHWVILPLRRYAEFAGRSRRQEIWSYFAGYVVLWSIVLGGIIAIGLAASGNLTNGNSVFSLPGIAAIVMSFDMFGVVILFLSLGLLLPTLAVQVRRLHDLEMSGWWLMISWGPYLIAFVILFVALASQSVTLIELAKWIIRLSWALFVVLLAIYCRPGMVGENRYGLDPKFGGANLVETFR